MEYEDFNILRFIEVRGKELRELCPEGIDRCHCMFQNGTYVDGPFYYEDGPIESGFLHATCNPDYCYCKNTPNVERDSRSHEMKVIMDLCPRGEMSRCLCQDKSVAQFPFDMTTFMQTCKPDKVSKGNCIF